MVPKSFITNFTSPFFHEHIILKHMLLYTHLCPNRISTNKLIYLALVIIVQNGLYEFISIDNTCLLILVMT